MNNRAQPGVNAVGSVAWCFGFERHFLGLTVGREYASATDD